MSSRSNSERDAYHDERANGMSKRAYAAEQGWDGDTSSSSGGGAPTGPLMDALHESIRRHRALSSEQFKS